MVEQTKHIFVTGGVASSLGKGLTASSLGHLLRARGLRVTMQKLDPYLNVDPGTMNPFQHGEVFVTDDGAETDLDIGHYERFLDSNLVGQANVTTGQVYNQVIAKERRGEYLGDTVQVIPHITNEIKERMRAQAAGSPGVPAAEAPDVIITEIGGTVGDIESLPFLEAARQVRHDVGRDNVFFLHVSLVPYLAPSGELKTKPTQHSVAALRQVGIQPDGLVLRADREIPDGIKRKISLMCDVDTEAVRRGRRRPEHLRHPQGPAQRGPRRLRHPPARPELPRRRLARLGRAPAPRPQPRAHRRDRARRQVHRPARRLPLGHRGAAGRRLPPRRQGRASAGSPATSARPRPARRRRSAASTPCSSPAASACAASRARSARCAGRASARCPTLGICLGLQCMVIEYARNVAGIEGASSTEFDPETPAPVIATMEEQKAFVEGAGDLGGTMRLGLLPGQAARGLGRRRGLRRGRGRRAAPAPLRGQQRLPRRARGGRPGLLRALARQGARRVRRAAPRGAPLLRLDAGPPRVQVAPAPRPPAVRRARRGGDRRSSAPSRLVEVERPRVDTPA